MVQWPSHQQMIHSLGHVAPTTIVTGSAAAGDYGPCRVSPWDDWFVPGCLKRTDRLGNFEDRFTLELDTVIVRTISKRTQYGLRAAIALGREYGRAPVLISRLAKEEAIPIKFLELILLDLKGQGVLESKSGKGGGYRLAKPPDQVTMGALIRMLEGPLAPLPCASESAFKPCDTCVSVELCGIRMVMRQVRDSISGVLDNTTLADIIQRVEEAKKNLEQHEPLMYYI